MNLADDEKRLQVEVAFMRSAEPRAPSSEASPLPEIPPLLSPKSQIMERGGCIFIPGHTRLTLTPDAANSPFNTPMEFDPIMETPSVASPSGSTV